MVTDSSLTRRRLLRNGAAGTAAIYLASRWEVLDSAALGAPLSPVMRRSTWVALTGSTVVAGGHSLRVVDVADLPIATAIPALQGHDGAFVVRFSGAAGLPAGTVPVAGNGGLAASLFIAAVEGATATQRYEAVIDRTIRIAGINEEGSPTPVEPSAVRVAQTLGPVLPALRTPVTPRLVSTSLRRGSSSRRATAEVVLAQTRDVVSVRVSLLRGRTAIARASSQERTPHRLRLRLLSGSELRPGRYRLVVRMTARDGRVTTVRRSVKLR